MTDMLARMRGLPSVNYGKMGSIVTFAFLVMSGEWTVIESTDGKRVMEEEEAVTDICLLTKKEKVPSGYTVVRRQQRATRL